MFRTAAKKIAHNTTIPVLGGNKDLRSLQDLITAEKSVLTSIQRLSSDITKASEALKTWGIGEGDDLGDILSASCALFLQFADALTTYADHEASVRDHMKSVRTREERLDDLRRRRRSLASDADSAEKKLSKMNPDNKNLQTQTDHLNKLRDEIRIMDTDIMSEEASLGDYKRSSTKSWMGLKFGGLAECSEKGLIVGDFGKQLIAGIPMDKTEPGLSRALYQGHAQADAVLAEARRAANEIYFSRDPRGNTTTFYSPDMALMASIEQRQSGVGQFGPGNSSRRTSMSPSSISMPVPSTDDASNRLSQVLRSPASGYINLFPSPQLAFAQPSGQSVSYETPQTAPSPGDTSEFGMFPPESYPARASTVHGADERERYASPRSSRFTTFPNKAVGPRPPPGHAGRNSLISGVPPLREGNRAPSLDVEQPEDSFSSSVAQALGEFELEENIQGASTSSRHTSDQLDAIRPSIDSQLRSYSPPPPMYSAVGTPSQFESSSQDEKAEARLAYVVNPEESSPRSSMQRERDDRRVTFEGSPAPEADIHEEQGENAAVSQPEQEGSEEVGRRSDTVQSDMSGEGFRSQQPEPISTYITTSTDTAASEEPDAVPSREPTPTDEKALNAAAAREVSRELDALMFNVSLPPPSMDRTPSPLQPPQAPFAQRTVSSRLDIEISTSPPTSPRMGPQYVRERERSLASPSSLSSVTNGETAPPTPSAPPSRFGSDRASSASPPAINVVRNSPSPSGVSASTAFRTPPEYMTPTGSQPNPSFYSLSSTMTGSGTSFSSGTGKISAAAFRRQQQMRSPSVPLPMPEGAPGAVDTSHLVIKKRQLPQSPGLSQSPRLGPSIPRVPSAPLTTGGVPDDNTAAFSRNRSASVAQAGDGVANSPLSQSPNLHERGASDDFDYISAYTDTSDNGKP